MISPEIVARLRSSRDWLVVQKYMEAEVVALNTLPEDRGMNDRALAIEVEARKLSIAKLTAILKPFVEYRSPADTDGLRQERAAETGLA